MRITWIKYATMAWGTDTWIRCTDKTTALVVLGLDLEGLDLDCDIQVEAEQTSWSDTPLYTFLRHDIDRNPW